MIVFIWGTRPEAVKIGPVVAELRAIGVQPKLISTGQHWDLLRGTPAETDLCDSESLGLPANGDPWQWVDQAVQAWALWLHSVEPPLPTSTIVVVQGDTASALAGARFAHTWGLPLVHIEAGIRSGNLEEPYPEERFRHEITQLAQWHYAPTSHCVENLSAEGIPEDRITLTGNPVVSALARYAEVSPAQPPEQTIVVTMHRREWVSPETVRLFFYRVENFCTTHPEFTVRWPVHPSVWNIPSAPFWDQRAPNLSIEEPLPYREMIALLSRAWGLATDSGGLVEEAATLGIPTAILRNANDRPEAVQAGIARQFAPTDVETALDWLTQDHPRKPSSVFGTPDAAAKIAKHLASLGHCFPYRKVVS